MRIFPLLSKCELCGSPSPLCRSHIIPAFVYRQVLSDSKRFHSATRPRLLVQDGERVHLLCKDCEGQISSFERSFQRLVFPGKQMGSLPFSYDETLYRFCCSVSWRVLTYLKLSTSDSYIRQSSISKLLARQVPANDHRLCDSVRDGWAQTICRGASEANDQHIVFLNGKNVPLERSDIVGFTLFQHGRDLATISFLGPIVIVGFVRQGAG